MGGNISTHTWQLTRGDGTGRPDQQSYAQIHHTHWRRLDYIGCEFVTAGFVKNNRNVFGISPSEWQSWADVQLDILETAIATYNRKCEPGMRSSRTVLIIEDKKTFGLCLALASTHCTRHCSPHSPIIYAFCVIRVGTWLINSQNR